MRDQTGIKTLGSEKVVAVVVCLVLASGVGGAPAGGTEAAVAADRTNQHSHHGGTIKLLMDAQLEGSIVRLRDVAYLDGPGAESFGDLEVLTLDPAHSHAEITRPQVRLLLDRSGAHWGRLRLTGWATCRVVRSEIPKPSETPFPDTAIDTALDSGSLTSLVANPINEMHVGAIGTVHDRLVTFLDQFAGIKAERMHLEFSARDDEVLQQPLWAEDRVEFEPIASGPLGRVPILLRIYRGDEPVHTYRVTADIAEQVMAVVVRRTISRGQTFSPGDLEIRQILHKNGKDRPLTDLSAVTGQTATTVLREGAVVTADNVQPPVMVRRGGLVTVRCLLDNMVVKTVARAVTEGRLGDVIEVRAGSAKHGYTVRITGPQQAVVAETPDQTKSDRSGLDQPINNSPVIGAVEVEAALTEHVESTGGA